MTSTATSTRTPDMAHKLAPKNGAYDLIAFDPDRAPTLPSRHGGIAIAAWYQGSEPRPPAEIEVDGKPAFRGWGRAIVVVPAGEHTVSLVGDDNGAAVTSVTVGERQVIDLDLLARYTLVGRSRFGTSPLRPPFDRVGRVVLSALLALASAGFLAVIALAVVKAAPFTAVGAIAIVPVILGLAFGLRARATVRETRLRQLEKFSWK